MPITYLDEESEVGAKITYLDEDPEPTPAKKRFGAFDRLTGKIMTRRDVAITPEQIGKAYPVAGNIMRGLNDIVTIPAHFLNQRFMNIPRSLTNTLAGEEAYPVEASTRVGNIANRLAGLAGGLTSPMLGAVSTLGRGAEIAKAPLRYKALAGLATGAAYSPDDDIVGIPQRIGGGVLGAATGAAAPVVGKAIANIPQATSKAAAGMINSLVKPLMKHFSYGKNPGRGVAQEGIVANTMEELGQKIGERADAIGKQIFATVKKAKTLVQMSGVLRPLDVALARARKAPNTNQALITRLEGAREDLRKIVGEMLQLAKPEVALKMKQQIGNMTKWTGAASDDAAVNKALKMVYGRLKDRLNKAVPKVAPLNERFADLLSATSALKHRVAYQNAQGMKLNIGAHPGLAGGIIYAMMNPERALPSVLAGVGVEALEATLKNPAVATRVASWLQKASDLEKRTLWAAAPKLGQAIEKVYGNLEAFKRRAFTEPINLKSISGKGGFVGSRSFKQPTAAKGQTALVQHLKNQIDDSIRAEETRLGRSLNSFEKASVSTMVQETPGGQLQKAIESPGVKLKPATTSLMNSPAIKAAEEKALNIPETIHNNSQERMKLREGIVSQIYKSGAANKGKRIDIVMGLPGSGKSSRMVDPLAEKYGSMVIDADEVKRLIPEYQRGIGSNAVHKESAIIAEDYLMTRAINNGDNIVYPTIGRTLRKLQQKIDTLNQLGYEVHLHNMSISPDSAISRSITRYQDGGRFVPPEYIQSLGLTPQKNYDILKMSKGVKSYENWSNEVAKGQSPTLVEARSRGIQSGRGQRGIAASLGVEEKPYQDLSKVVSYRIAKDIPQSSGAGKIPKQTSAVPLESIKSANDEGFSRVMSNPDRYPVQSGSPIVQNMEYGPTFTPDTTCAKGKDLKRQVIMMRQALTEMGADAQIKTAASRKLYQAGLKQGLETPCLICYEFEKQLTGYNAKPFSSGIKMYKPGEITRHLPEIRSRGGLIRGYGAGDFQAGDIPSLMALGQDLQQNGLSYGGYTKNLNQLEIFGDTGMKFNISSGPTKDFGIPLDIVKVYRKRYPNSGILWVSPNEADLLKMGPNPDIDAIIPAHIGGGTPSGWIKESTGQSVENFQRIQSERVKWQGKDTNLASLAQKLGGKFKEAKDALSRACWNRDSAEYLSAVKEQSKKLGIEIIPKFDKYKDKSWYHKLIGTGPGEYGQNPKPSKIDMGNVNLQKAQEYMNSPVQDKSSLANKYAEVARKIMNAAKKGGVDAINKLDAKLLSAILGIGVSGKLISEKEN